MTDFGIPALTALLLHALVPRAGGCGAAATFGPPRSDRVNPVRISVAGCGNPGLGDPRRRKNHAPGMGVAAVAGTNTGYRGRAGRRRFDGDADARRAGFAARAGTRSDISATSHALLSAATTYQSLFAFSMMGLVLAPNLLQLFMCWELVGSARTCSSATGINVQRPPVPQSRPSGRRRRAMSACSSASSSCGGRAARSI